jgi:uncharacterized membrane protein YphA (DoxX/SURF4 family)
VNRKDRAAQNRFRPGVDSLRNPTPSKIGIRYIDVAFSSRHSRRRSLQKLFSSFPEGWPGIGLLLLRLTVGLSAILQALFALARPGAAAISVWSVVLAAILIGLALLIGFLTPFASALAAFGDLTVGVFCYIAGVPGDYAKFIGIGYVASMSVALLMLGPGAFSLDARLFGRREIIIPEGRRSADS